MARVRANLLLFSTPDPGASDRAAADPLRGHLGDEPFDVVGAKQRSTPRETLARRADHDRPSVHRCACRRRPEGFDRPDHRAGAAKSPSSRHDANASTCSQVCRPPSSTRYSLLASGDIRRRDARAYAGARGLTCLVCGGFTVLRRRDAGLPRRSRQSICDRRRSARRRGREPDRRSWQRLSSSPTAALLQPGCCSAAVR